MIRKIITIIGMLLVLPLQGYNGSFVSDLASRNLSVVSMHNIELSHTLKKVLDKVSKPNAEFELVFADSDTKKIFIIDLSTCADLSVANSVRTVQYLILLSLYQQMFQHYIVASETFLNDLLIAKKYWMHEDFYMKQPFFGKNIVYNFYSSEYKNTITAKLAALHEIENNIASILGFCLYGLSNVQKINSQDLIVEQMTLIIDQFFKLFNAPELNHEEKNDPFVVYNHALWMHDNIQQHMNLAQSGMQQNNKTPFLVDHCVGISCATLGVIAAAVFYVKNKDTVHGLYAQVQTAVPYFWKEYIVNPVVGLKEVLWEQKTKKLEHVEHFSDIPKFSDIPQSADIPEYDGYNTFLVNPILNPLVKGINTTKKDFIKTANGWKDNVVKTANEWKDASEKTLNAKIDEANDTIIKNNQVNMYLAAIVPGLLGTSALSFLSYKTYNYYVKHKNWHLPMRYIIRSIDQLVNQIARSSTEHSFMDDGKLYMLIQHFRGYIVCLDNEELFLMDNDIDELLSFDLNYAQKKGVIDRMYKTYEFLK
jgi:hypothetical protein